MAELDNQTYAEIQRLSEKGEAEFEYEGGERKAITFWRQALNLVPEPHSDWEASLWLHTHIGDAQAELGQIDEALESYRKAYEAPDGHTNPYLLLQMGKLLHDRGDTDQAADMLLRAYMMEGEELFEDGDEDYLQALRDNPKVAV